MVYGLWLSMNTLLVSAVLIDCGLTADLRGGGGKWRSSRWAVWRTGQGDFDLYWCFGVCVGW